MATANYAEHSADVNLELEAGEIVECTVEQMMPYGAFVRIAKNGRKGMIHISELSYSFVKDINDVLKISDKIKAKIIRIDDRGRIDLSIKQTLEPPAPRTQRHNQNQMQPRFSRQENFKPRSIRDSQRDFFDLKEAYREAHPEEADTFEKKMASFLKTSEAKITDLNTRNSSRSGRNSRRRNNNRD